jgi:hypothetical protein
MTAGSVTIAMSRAVLRLKVEHPNVAVHSRNAQAAQALDEAVPKVERLIQTLRTITFAKGDDCVTVSLTDFASLTVAYAEVRGDL